MPILFWFFLLYCLGWLIWLLVKGLFVVALLQILVFILFMSRILKSSLLLVTAPCNWRFTSPEEFPRIDLASLNSTTQDWVELGFTQVSDWVTGESRPKLGITFVRLIEQPNSPFLVQLVQTLQPKRTLPQWQAVMSYWGDAETLKRLSRELNPTTAPIASPNEAPFTPKNTWNLEMPMWMFSTHNAPKSWLRNAYLHPRALGQRTIFYSPQDLLAAHHSNIGRLKPHLLTPLISTGLTDICLSHGQLIRPIWHARIKKTLAVPLLWRTWRRGTKRTEYWGELSEVIEG